MKESGSIIRPMVKVNSGMLLEIFIRAIGLMTKLMALGCTTMLMERGILASGRTISRKDMAMKLLPMVQIIKASTMME